MQTKNIPDKPQTPTPITKVTRLMNGAIIIGKTYKSKNTIVILDPYTVLPTQEGLQMYPFDKDLLGVDLKEMVIDTNQTMYSEEPSTELSTTYLTNLSGIEIPTSDLIL